MDIYVVCDSDSERQEDRRDTLRPTASKRSREEELPQQEEGDQEQLCPKREVAESGLLFL